MIDVWEFHSATHWRGESAVIRCTIALCDVPDCTATCPFPGACDRALSQRDLVTLREEGWTTDDADHDLCPAHRGCVIDEEGDR